MKKQIQKLRPLIQGSIFLKEEQKEKLLANLHKATKKDLATLEAIFGHARKYQENLIDDIVEYDDTFVARLKGFKQAEINKFSQKVEKKQRKKEKAEDILKKLE